MESFKYLIGYPWQIFPDDINPYDCFGIIKYGNLQEANEFLEFAKTRNPGKELKLFKVIPIEN